jgi:hypothetical protein
MSYESFESNEAHSGLERPGDVASDIPRDKKNTTRELKKNRRHSRSRSRVRLGD